MAVTFGAVSTTVYSASAGVTVAPTYPTGITAGQLLLLHVAVKPSTVGGGTVTNPAGWTLVGSVTGAGGYGSTIGNAVGNTNLYVYQLVAVGTETGTVTLTLANSSVAWASISRYTGTGSGWATPAVGVVDVASAPTSPMTVTFPPMETAPGDALVVLAAVTGSVSFSNETLAPAAPSASQLTLEAVEPSTSTGNDIAGVLCHSQVVSGTATGAPVFVATLGTPANARGGYLLLRLRETGDVPQRLADVTLMTAATVVGALQRFSDVTLTTAATTVASPQRVADVALSVAATPPPGMLGVDHVHVYVAIPVVVTLNMDAISVITMTSQTGGNMNNIMVTVLSDYVPDSGNNVWVWDGVNENPANVAVWDGTIERPTTVDVFQGGR